MKRSFLSLAAGLAGAAFALSGYSGGGRVASGPATIPYVCEDGRQAAAVYESGGDFLHAKVLLTFDGRTNELEAAPTPFGTRYRGEPSAADPRALVWTLRGERAFLDEATEAHISGEEGRPIARCMRLRTAMAPTATAEAGHSEDDH